jgi:hypothetical protein
MARLDVATAIGERRVGRRGAPRAKPGIDPAVRAENRVLLGWQRCEDGAMFVAYDQTWGDQNSSWWAKINRAQEHIAWLHRLVNEFRQSGSYSLTPEPTEIPGRLADRLRFNLPVPVALSTTVGDALHNMRAALESLAFEAARLSQGGSLTSDQEKTSTFPICESPDAFGAFFKGKKGLLYDGRSRAAFRSVQPFVNLEQAEMVGVALDQSFDERFRWDVLHRLDTLWNIDKHRRLTLMAWWPGGQRPEHHAASAALQRRGACLDGLGVLDPEFRSAGRW